MSKRRGCHKEQYQQTPDQTPSQLLFHSLSLPKIEFHFSSSSNCTDSDANSASITFLASARTSTSTTKG